MKTIIIDYGSGNVESVLNALNLVKDETSHEILISKNPDEIRLADRLILPGVGAFADCMKGLKSVEGLLEEIKNQVLVEKKPFLGVCVGMQVLARSGFEDGECQGLGFIDGEVKKITGENLIVPHMGWNDLVVKPNQHDVLKGIKTGNHFYFANSYYFQCQDEDDALASVEYGSKLNVIVSKENILGLQFHPEKSGEDGLKILKNFLNWQPS